MKYFSYSSVSTFEQCPYRYKLQYIDGLQTLPTDDATNALVVGSALHKAIETDIDTAIEEYFNFYPVISDLHVDEEIKLRYLIPQVKELLPEGTHEVKVVDSCFKGFLDLLVPAQGEMNGKNHICDACEEIDCYAAYGGDCPLGKFYGEIPNTFDLYDFKYSNNWLRYMDSRQLHLYKFYFEKMNPGKRIRDMYFLFVPKVQIRQKKTETLFEFRQRLYKELEKVKPELRKVEYDSNKVIEHLEMTQQILQCQNFEKNHTKLCDWCEYKKYCYEREEIEMALPSTERVAQDATNYKKIWIYGAPFSGKTTVCDSAPTPLNLNTDGNVKTVTMARLPIKDTMEGRQKKLAWEVFKSAIDDLEAGSDFETVVVDLLEDTYESCRLFMYKQMGITHESDDSFRAWDKVRTEFLSTFRRLLNLPYNVVLLSHEDMSKDITKKTGDKITAIKPNIQDKIANKIAGMVDIVCRVLVEDDGRYLSFKSDSVVFGGGRIQGHGKTTIPLAWGAIEEFYAGVNAPKLSQKTENVAEVETPVETQTVPEMTTPQRRVRRTRVEQ